MIRANDERQKKFDWKVCLNAFEEFPSERVEEKQFMAFSWCNEEVKKWTRDSRIILNYHASYNQIIFISAY